MRPSPIHLKGLGGHAWDGCKGRFRYSIVFLSLMSTLSHLGALRARQNNVRKFARNVISVLCQVIGKPQGAGPASALTWNLVWKQEKALQWPVPPSLGVKS